MNPAAVHVAAPARQLRRELASSHGEAMPAPQRRHYEALAWAEPGGSAGHTTLEAQADAMAGHGRRGVDFSQVLVHRDAAAQRAAAIAGAHALTFGQRIYLGAGAAGGGDALLQHELAHTRQQQALGRSWLQPRLIASGDPADIARFLAIAEPGMGEDLDFDAASGEITAVGSLATPPLSTAFATAMHNIIDDPVDNAEVHFGAAQDRVAVGAFPDPSDMTGATEQLIDIDDIEAFELGVPGSGLAKLAHELTENYEAHIGVTLAGGAVAGVDQFDVAHDAGIEAESDVAEDTLGPGRRVAEVNVNQGGGSVLSVRDFETYYQLFDITGSSTAAGTDAAVGNVRIANREHLLNVTIDAFADDSDAVPAAGAASIAAAAAAVLAAPTSTVRVEGFTDDRGSAAHNRVLGGRRARSAGNALAAAGIDGGRIHALGRGEVDFVAPNATEADRARNRRVVIQVDRPQP